MTHTNSKVATLAAAFAATLPLAATACEPSHAEVAVTRVATEVAPAAHVMIEPGDVAWAPGPGSLPPGAQFAVIEGDPTQAGPFTMRLSFPAGYRIPAHSHPAIEHITVLSGVFGIGTGDALDTSKGRAMAAGSFVVMPVGHNHFAWTDEATEVQLHGIGPWGITYVDPADDPRGS
jgi:quercetin dioxygenase-like cupin family protein